MRRIELYPERGPVTNYMRFERRNIRIQLEQTMCRCAQYVPVVTYRMPQNVEPTLSTCAEGFDDAGGRGVANREGTGM